MKTAKISFVHEDVFGLIKQCIYTSRSEVVLIVVSRPLMTKLERNYRSSHRKAVLGKISGVPLKNSRQAILRKVRVAGDERNNVL